jgi:hypothetical protein
MQSLPRSLVVLLVVVLSVPVLSAEDPKKADSKKEKLIPVGDPVTGKLTKVDSGMRFTLEVTTKEPYVSGKSVRTKDVKKSIDLVAADDMVVRLSDPPPVFNDKGERRKHTAKELAQLKGPGNLPGYKADAADIQKGQTVTVRLGQSRPPKPTGKDKPPPEPLKVMMMIIHSAAPAK